MSEVYRTAGVNLDAEHEFSVFAGEICKSTYHNSPFVEVHDFSEGHFRGPRGFRLKNLPDGVWLDAAPDGIGTKTILIDTAHSHVNAARDLVAMTAGDITRWGGLPLVFINTLEVAKLGEETEHRYCDLLRGLKRVADKQGFVCFRGETAQTGICVGSEMNASPTRFNWSGVMLGAYRPGHIITGETLAPGQIVMALREYGFRSNGLSAVRAGFRAGFGNEWWKNLKAERFIREAAEPSTLYDSFLATVHGWYKLSDPGPPIRPRIGMHAIAHLSGGSFKEKFADYFLFPQTLSVTLDDLWEPPEIMRRCAEWCQMGDEECYTVWNGGQGALVVIDEKDVRVFETLASAFSIEAKPCGRITEKNNPSLQILSKFTDGHVVRFTP